MKADPTVPAQEARRDTSQQAADAAARPVDLVVLAAASGRRGPVDVGGRDVVRVRVGPGRASPAQVVCRRVRRGGTREGG